MPLQPNIWTGRCDNGLCILVRVRADGSVEVRDSKLGGDSPVIRMDADAYQAVVRRVLAGWLPDCVHPVAGEYVWFGAWFVSDDEGGVPVALRFGRGEWAEYRAGVVDATLRVPDPAGVPS